MSVRFSEIVKPFRGDGTQAVETWLKNLELVARLQKVEDLASFLPLFLEGAAFSVYEQMAEANKDKFSLLKAGLLAAFAVNRFTAYDQLRSRRLAEGESVDVFLADIRRFTSLACVTDEELVKNAFVLGLPPFVSKQLRALSNVDDLALSELVVRARMLVADCPEPLLAAAAATAPALPALPRRRYPDGSCHRCGRFGHFTRNCPRGNDNGESLLAPVPSPQ